jgi:hypothetical protein
MAVVAIIGMEIIMIFGTGIGTGHGFPASGQGSFQELLSVRTEGQKETRGRVMGVG